MKSLLEPFGAENDACLLAILSWCSENHRRVNSAELSLMGFRHFLKGRREWVAFSPETIARKARQLAEWGLLERGFDLHHHTWYEMKGNTPVRADSSPTEPIIRVVNGQRVAMYA